MLVPDDDTTVEAYREMTRAAASRGMVQLVRDIEARCPALELVGILAVGLKQSLMVAMDAGCSSIGKPRADWTSKEKSRSDRLE